MATRGLHHLSFLILACILSSTDCAKQSYESAETLNRSSFPAGFVFGASSASYQSEGAAFQDGRGLSIWDTFTNNYPEGKISGGVNRLGVQFYNNLINEVLSHGLQPYVTLFHWDLPQALDDDYGGFLSPKIVDDYLDYVDFCFTTFGDRVKHWLTLNEPYEFTVYGYGSGIYAPGRCSEYIGNCTSGNSATEPYIVGHHLILSHAAAVTLYREKYKVSQKGEIGITLSSKWIVPFSKNTANQKAAQRALDFMLGWFLHPMTYGDYPKIMKSLVGNRLPNFTELESQILKNSYDFLGINYYTSFYAANAVFFNISKLSVTTDNRVINSDVKNGVPIGEPTALSWLHICPKGIGKVVLYIKHNYGNPPIIITENGVAEANNPTLSLKESLEDELRITYHYEHLTYLLKAIKERFRTPETHERNDEFTNRGSLILAVSVQRREGGVLIHDSQDFGGTERGSGLHSDYGDDLGLSSMRGKPILPTQKQICKSGANNGSGVLRPDGCNMIIDTGLGLGAGLWRAFDDFPGKPT
ncbi:hypothetical protein TEA_022949 [Camellia sinensis var. sinensis]|uniref:Beta-glucosidase n=1 Tax=Camellia sinensis var. sinensis TaxID=542762 RepID=A0A4S4DKX6_CAMSN|nr:hypothetical protein TEA_022949 [Camellia sinensis var. sinensis]